MLMSWRRLVVLFFELGRVFYSVLPSFNPFYRLIVHFGHSVLQPLFLQVLVPVARILLVLVTR
jgi:hypothetical protein